MKKQSKYQEVVSYLKNGIESGRFPTGSLRFWQKKTWTSTTTPKEHTSLGAAFYLTKSLFIFCS